MLAKLTPFGDSNKGKTSALRALVYLLYKNADSNYRVIIRGPRNIHICGYPIKIPISSIYCGADFRISLNVQYKGKSVRICICTAGDNKAEIFKNWDFLWNKGQFKNEDYISPQIMVSPCNIASARKSEFDKQRAFVNMIDLLYWFKLPLDNKIINMQNQSEIDDLVKDADRYGVFSAHKNQNRLLNQQEKEAAMVAAKLIENKIYQLIELL